MSYFNGDNTNFYPTSTLGGFDDYPHQMPVLEHVDVCIPQTSTNGWSIHEQQGYAGGSLTSLRPEASFDSTSSETSYEVQTQSHNRPSSSKGYVPVVGKYAQSYYSSILGRDNSFASAAASEALGAAIYTPDTYPFNYWGDNESGPSASTFHINVQQPYQPCADSSGTGVMQNYWYPSYLMPSAHSNEHTNAEASPSNLALPLTSYVATPPTNPPGGTSEASADAENIQTTTEENAVPRETTRRRRGTGHVRAWQQRHATDVWRLCSWAQKRERLRRRPSHLVALRIALEVVQTLHPVPVYPLPRLRRSNSSHKVQGEAAEGAYRRREEIRRVNEDLSRFYRLPDGASVWECPGLLLKVLEDLEPL